MQHARAQSVVERTLLSLTDQQLHTRPYEGANSIAWIVWHMTRIEDLIAPIVVGEPQLLTEPAWAARLGVEARDVGTGMTDADIEAFNVQVNLACLREYYRGVGARTEEYAKRLRPEELDEVPDALRLPAMLQELGALGPNAAWVGEEFLAGMSKATVLSHLGYGHKQAHWGEAITLRGIMGVPGR